MFKPIEKVQKRLHNSRIQTLATFDRVIDEISQFESTADSLNDEDFSSGINSLFEKIIRSEPLKKVCQGHKETYAHIGRLGKESEKLFPYNIEELGAHKAEPLDKDILDSVFSDYLVSQGDINLANLIQLKDSNETEKIQKAYEAISLLKSGNVESALELVKAIGLSNKTILFNMHKLKFISLLKSNLISAIEYARLNFQPFQSSFSEEIEHLMGSCLYSSNPIGSPYENLFTDTYHQSIIQEILKEWSKCTEISTISPLSTLIEAGEQVIPDLLPIAKLAGERFWRDSMTTEFKLPNDLKFHSTFVCPVSKDIATNENPPMMLPCGHVIAKNSMDRLLSSTIRRVFKCPTCPVEVTEKDAMRIYF